jgi:hypothetical protein
LRGSDSAYGEFTITAPRKELTVGVSNPTTTGPTLSSAPLPDSVRDWSVWKFGTGHTKGTTMAIIAIPLHVKTPVVDEFVRTFRAQRPFGPPIWQADPPAPKHPQPRNTTALPVILMAFSYAERPA